jgi:membrane protein YqaA with SNARE-associated domain
MLRRLYEWTMAKAAHRHCERWLAAFAFMEASFFPVPPHPLLGLMCLAEPKKAIRFSAIATLASVAGGLLGYAIGYALYDTVGKWLIDLLGLSDGFAVAQCKLKADIWPVLLAFVVKGVTPIPFKLLTITAGFLAIPLWLFLLASLASRAISFMIVGVLFRLYGAPIKAFIDKYLLAVTAAFVALVIAGFAVLTLVDGGGDVPADDPCAEVARA